MKQTMTQSVISLLVLALFCWMAAGSVTEDTHKELGTDRYITNYYFNEFAIAEMRGERDYQRNWHGTCDFRIGGLLALLEILSGKDPNDVGLDWALERSEYFHGRRNGNAIYEYHLGCGEIRRYETEFENGIQLSPVRVREPPDDDEKSHAQCYNGESMIGNNAIDVMYNRYYWYFFNYIGREISEAYLVSFLDTLATMIVNQENYANRFSGLFNSSMDILAETEAYEEIAFLADALMYFVGLENLKHHEMRLAVIDRHWCGERTTFDFLKETYTGFYGFLLNRYEEDLIADFCDELDSKMDARGLLDRDDDFFLDSVDFRFNSVLTAMATGDEEKQAWLKQGRIDYRMLRQLALTWKKSTNDDTPGDVAFTVGRNMNLVIATGNPLRQVIRLAILPDEVREAIVTTSLADHLSPSGVVIRGNVLEDGNSEVTERGVAYAITYNPTTEHNVVPAGSGLGEFDVTIEGLAEGVTYYARSYAVTSHGTAYGNVVTITADATIGVPDDQVVGPLLQLNAYPVPASGLLWVSVGGLGHGRAQVELINMSGQVVSSQMVSLGVSQDVAIDIAGMVPGVYFVRVDDGKQLAVQKLIIR